nr:tubulin-like doman-containing protein [Tessaracoccus coleopterorum]
MIVGCGGSGGRTVRLLIDQLRADLRARGIAELPDAWQFVHIDVPVDPDKGPARSATCATSAASTCRSPRPPTPTSPRPTPSRPSSARRATTSRL